jgi:Response regulator receiver domain
MLVRAYLEVMHMRMPDRLQYTLLGRGSAEREWPSGDRPVESARATAAGVRRRRAGAGRPVRAARCVGRDRVPSPAERRLMGRRPTALIADDEPLLRKGLVRMLADAWPELDGVALARNGREAVERFAAQEPDICFLDMLIPCVQGSSQAMIGPYLAGLMTAGSAVVIANLSVHRLEPSADRGVANDQPGPRDFAAAFGCWRIMPAGCACQRPLDPARSVAFARSDTVPLSKLLSTRSSGVHEKLTRRIDGRVDGARRQSAYPSLRSRAPLTLR